MSNVISEFSYFHVLSCFKALHRYFIGPHYSVSTNDRYGFSTKHFSKEALWCHIGITLRTISTKVFNVQTQDAGDNKLRQFIQALIGRIGTFRELSFHHQLTADG